MIGAKAIGTFVVRREGSEPAQRGLRLVRVAWQRVPVDPEARGQHPPLVTAAGPWVMCGELASERGAASEPAFVGT